MVKQKLHIARGKSITLVVQIGGGVRQGLLDVCILQFRLLAPQIFPVWIKSYGSQHSTYCQAHVPNAWLSVHLIWAAGDPVEWFHSMVAS